MQHVYEEMTLGTYLEKNGYSQGFIDNYIVPMCAAVWSVPGAQVRHRLQMGGRQEVRGGAWSKVLELPALSARLARSGSEANLPQATAAE